MQTINRFEEENRHLFNVIEQYECNMREMNSRIEYQIEEISMLKENSEVEVLRLKKELKECKEDTINLEEELLQVKMINKLFNIVFMI